jgi:hypothetical protein
MADAKGIRAGRAFVEVFADDSKLVRGLHRAQARLKAFGMGVRNIGLGMMAMGAAVAAPILAAARSFGDFGTKIFDMSKRTGIAAEDLSLLGYAGEQAGTSLEAVEKGVRRMQKSVGDATSGTREAVDSLAELGLTVSDLMGKAPAEQFALIASRLRRITDPTLRTAAAMNLFGKSGTELLPMIDTFEDLAREARGRRRIMWVSLTWTASRASGGMGRSSGNRLIWRDSPPYSSKTSRLLRQAACCESLISPR